MFTDKAAAIVAMVFAAVILTHPGPGFASSHMGVLPSPGAGKGIIAQEKPAEFKPGAQTAAPGAKVGAQPDDTLPGTSAIDIDKALLGESLDLGAGLPTLPTATQGGVALRGGNVMQQLGDDGQRPGGIAAKGASPPVTFGGAASKVIIINNMPGSPGKLPAGKGMMIKGK